MKKNFILKAYVSALLLASSNAMQAQHSWAIAKFEYGNNWPSFTECHCMPEKGANGIEYLRIYESVEIDQLYYNPVKQQYGYRMPDKQIFIYDFETDEERLAFDFSLTVGDHFITYNGIEWEVETAIDTLVNTSYLGGGGSSTKRLLKVHSVDGRYSDQWLEDFGSFSNHFMILPMSETGQTLTLWMEYEYGNYLVREISSDPFFAHDSGIPKESDYEDEYVNCTYKDGTLIVEDGRWRSPNREYTCFYRVADDFYCAYIWELNPATDIGEVVWYKDVAYYYGLPDPKTGKYTMHFNMVDRPSGGETIIIDLTNVINNSMTDSSIYDLYGHKYTSIPIGDSKPPQRGVYIRDGKKYVVR